MLRHPVLRGSELQGKDKGTRARGGGAKERIGKDQPEPIHKDGQQIRVKMATFEEQAKALWHQFVEDSNVTGITVLELNTLQDKYFDDREALAVAHSHPPGRPPRRTHK